MIALRRMMHGYNAAPQAELLGLSPNQLMQLLDGDWRTTGAVRLTSRLTGDLAGRAWAFRAALAFMRLVITQGSAPVTATGNLTRKFVALAVEALDFPPGYLDRIRQYNKVINEPDVGRLFELRHTLVEAGYLRGRAGFRVTPLGRKALELVAVEPGAVFRRLFLARMGLTGNILDKEGVTFRSPLGPALFLLQERAADWIESPALMGALLIPHLVPHQTVYQLGSLAWQWVVAPCRDFGLVDVREGARLIEPDHVRITPLFGEFISFRFDLDGRRPPVARPPGTPGVH